MPVDHVKDPRPLLLAEKLSLEGQIEPLAQRLTKVNRLLKDAVTKDGPYTDEERSLVVMLQPRNRTYYDPDLLRQHFPMLAEGVIVESTTVDPEGIKQAIAIGAVTESELEAKGVRIRETVSQALVVKPLKEVRPV